MWRKTAGIAVTFRLGALQDGPRMTEHVAEDEPLVAAWLAHTSRPSEATFPTWYEVGRLCSSDFERGWRLARTLLERIPAEQLGAVGAGPLEDLLHAFPDQAGPHYIEMAGCSPRFREALTYVRIIRGQVPAAIREALGAASRKMPSSEEVSLPQTQRWLMR